MALVKCPECGRDTSDAAKSCPLCGYPIPGRTAVLTKPETRKQQKPQGEGWFWAGVVAAGIIITTIAGSNTSNLLTSTDENCSQELKCTAEKSLVNASSLCAPNIEKLAKYNFEWTNWAIDPKLSHYRWKDDSKQVIVYRGDKIKFQNGFGAWTISTYECDFDANSQRVLAVRAYPGRIN
jgi:hypothetical protein